MSRVLLPAMGLLLVIGVGAAVGDEPLPVGAVALRPMVGGKDRLLDALAFSPNGKLLAVAGYNPHVIHLFDPGTHKEVNTCTGHTKGVRHVAFSPDSKRLASAAKDGT